MSEVFTTSDLHFWHKNILKFCPNSRPFSSVEEMNEAIITNWNKKVSKKDTIYILGDISFGSVKNTVPLVERLNGKKYLIIGNHDEHCLNSQWFCSHFMGEADYTRLKINKKDVILFHYEIKTWDKKHYGSYHLHGHLHSKNPEILLERKYDVGIDGSSDFAPYHLETLLDDIENRLDKTVNQKLAHHPENYR